jgi:UDP-galactose transporter B1
MPPRPRTAAPMPRKGASSVSTSVSSPAVPSPRSHGEVATYLLQMLGCTLGIYACYFTWGVVHERVATHNYRVDGKKRKFDYYIVTSLIGAFCMIITCSACLGVLRAVGRRVRFVPTDMKKFAMLGFTMTFAGPLGLHAAKHLSYPVYLAVKMCKMVPTVIVGSLWHRMRYTTLKYASVVLITAGVLGFSLQAEGDDSNAANNTPQSTTEVLQQHAHTTIFSVILCFIGMTLDGYTNSTQDAILKVSPGMHALQMMLGSAMCMVVWCFATLVVAEAVPAWTHTKLFKPELRQAAHFIHEEPQALWDVMLLGALNSVGAVFILTGVGLFGSLTMIAVMITRKVGSIFISIAVHGHSVTLAQWLWLATVIVGVIVDTVDGVKNKKHKRH